MSNNDHITSNSTPVFRAVSTQPKSKARSSCHMDEISRDLVVHLCFVFLISEAKRRPECSKVTWPALRAHIKGLVAQEMGEIAPEGASSSYPALLW